MRLFARRVEHPLDVTVQCPHDAATYVMKLPKPGTEPPRMADGDRGADYGGGKARADDARAHPRYRALPSVVLCRSAYGIVASSGTSLKKLWARRALYTVTAGLAPAATS